MPDLELGAEGEEAENPPQFVRYPRGEPAVYGTPDRLQAINEAHAGLMYIIFGLTAANLLTFHQPARITPLLVVAALVYTSSFGGGAYYALTRLSRGLNRSQIAAIPLVVVGAILPSIVMLWLPGSGASIAAYGSAFVLYFSTILWIIDREFRKYGVRFRHGDHSANRATVEEVRRQRESPALDTSSANTMAGVGMINAIQQPEMGD